ncbi:M16 family metallopeptidase [Luteolibacter algae]|uniref:M16 family metallopeptidase n=1 Tax=Luteolibacter algae TaxID=454151 RepID=A0ABW5DAU8_9BACT
MRNATPLVLALILGVTAFLLAIKETPQPTAAEQTAVETSEKTASADSSGNRPSSPEDGSEAAAVEPTPWPSETSDIPPDPQAVFGALPNGLRYMILPNDEPPNRLSMRLHIAAGSLMEAEDQRGLAHFLEHMVFNGTKSYKDANQLIREMQNRGIAFGAHVNAYTSFDETVYMLDLPDIEPDTLDLTFGIMRDFGDGALLSEEEIDAERGVILSEKRSRDSVGYRMQQKQFDALLPNSLIAKRFPIGEEKVIESAPRERFLDFYNRYYVPSKITFVVVGNIDPADIEIKIKETFSSMKNPENPGQEPDLGVVTTPEGIEPHIFSDAELDSTDVSLLLVRPYDFKPDTREARAAKIPLEIANFVIGRRFDRLAKKENSPISDGEASKFVLFNDLELGSISVTVADDRWQEATPLLEQEFRRALEYGFTEAELAEAKANLLNIYEESVKRKDTRKSDSLATAIARSINDETVFSTPEENLEIVKSALESTDIAKVHQEFVKFWEAPGHHLVLATKTASDEASNELAAIYQESVSVQVDPPAAREIIPFGYTDFGKAGRIEKTTEIEDLEVTQLTLTNQIRVNLKKTDFEKNRIHVLARIGTGQLSQPKDKPLLNAVASTVFNAGGLGKHSADELSEILAGRNVSATLSISEDAFILSGSTTPADLLLQLQLMVASITDPGYRPEAIWQFQKSIPVLYQNLKHTTAGPSQEMKTWLHGGDFRYSIPSQTELSNYTIEEVKSWLTPELEKGYLELSVVGDFDEETLVNNLLATFGSLPERNKTQSDNTLNTRSVEFPNPPAEKTFTYESKIPQAMATAIWKTDGLRGNLEEFRRLNVLSDIYGDRLREEIREKLGASYSPNAGASGSDSLENMGYLVGQAIGKPEDIALLLSTMEKIATELSEKGASQDELDRALKPTLAQLEKTLRDNSYWLSTVLAQSQSDPNRLDLARNRDEDYRSINIEEINKLAEKYFAPSQLLKVSILPAE